VRLEHGAGHIERGGEGQGASIWTWPKKKKNPPTFIPPTFHGLPQFPRIPKATQDMNNRYAPRALRNYHGVAITRARYERCWCRGFNIGCGRIRSPTTRYIHRIKHRKIVESKNNIMTRRIHSRSLIETLGRSMQSCMACGNLNMNQRTRMFNF